MTNDEQRIAIAEACGWERWKQSNPIGIPKVKLTKPRDDTQRSYWIYCGCVLTPNEVFTEIDDKIPDYLNDLNAMHEAEKVLTEENWGDYTSVLEWLMGIEQKSERYRKLKLIHATAAQRAEAFLKTIDKWKE